MKSLIALYSVLANELAGRCSTSTTLDLNTVRGRVESEGMSFLTITLPTFGKDFQFCLDQGFVVPKAFLPFRKSGSCLPSFLRGFTEQVFDSGTGVLLSNPNVEAIYAVRQLTLIFSKMLLPCTPERERRAMSDYVQCDMEVDQIESTLPSSDVNEFGDMAQLLFSDLFSYVDKQVYENNIIPKHGPGAVAERLTSNGKYRSQYWTDRLEEVFHVGDFLLPNARFIEDGYEEDGIDFREPGDEIPSRVISVPKTQKAPRIIAIEPSSVQYVQQGILEVLMHKIHASYLDGFIGTRSQIPNQDLARIGSETQTLATLDLSEASDRVSFKLVKTLMRNHQLSLAAVSACRSERASVPGQGIISLSKFASMGSALCFPFEAMVFLTIIFLGIQKDQGHRLTRKDVLSFRDRVRVYGDDLIVPVEYVHTVADLLEHFGARVGRSKSFWNGKFRESCGKEYYSGQDVSLVKVRNMFPSQQQQVTEVVSLVELRNQLYYAGNWDVVRWLDGKIEGILPVFPKVLPTSPGLGRHSFLGYVSEKEDEHLHKPLVKACVVSSRSPRDPLDGPGALLKFFLKRGPNPVHDEEHLRRAGRPRTAYIKTRWVPPF